MPTSLSRPLQLTRAAPKGLFLTLLDIEGRNPYSNKILGQASAFLQEGLEIDLLSVGPSTVVLRRGTGQAIGEPSIRRRYARFPYNNRRQLFREALQYIKVEAPAFIYIRYPLADPLYLLFLKALRRYSVKRVLAELPTYPYDQIAEFRSSLRGRLLLAVDRLCRPFLRRYLDALAVVDCEGRIFGIEVLTIHNGIDVSKYRPVGEPRRLAGTLRLIGVANLMDYHGYDRVVAGMRDFEVQAKKPIDVEFHVVGPETPALQRLKGDVDRSVPRPRVFFHGAKTGAELDELMEQCHVGVGSLAWHRVELRQASNLKTREYMARGMPCIYSAGDVGIPGDFPYAMRLDSDDTAAPIWHIVEFAQRVYAEGEHPSKMRAYAERHLGWRATMRAVFSAIKVSTP